MSEPPGSPPLRMRGWLEGDDSKPVLVLGNSLGTSRQVWDPQVPALARHFRLLRYELPGHGGARADGTADEQVPPGPYSIAGLGAGVLALLDHFGVERAGYCGVSLGAMIGMWLAAHAPERVTALALCCTSACMPPASGWHDRAALVRSAGLAAVIEASLGRWFTPSFARSAPEVMARIGADLAQVVPEGYAGCCEAIAAMDLRPALGAITTPTLVISAAEDPSAPPPHGALIARQVSGARLEVVRGAAHLANVQAPGPVTAALLRHLLLRRG